MSALRRPWIAYALFLFCLAGVGAVLLASEAATTIEARPDMRFYWALHYWESAFDAFSAATGCGLATHRWSSDLTPFGEITILCVGTLSAIGYLLALYHCLPPARSPAIRRRSIALIMGWLVTTVCIFAVLFAVLRANDARSDWGISTQSPWTALLSLGSARVADGQGASVALALFAALGGGGWFALLMARRLATLGVTWKSAIMTWVVYAAVIGALAVLVLAFDSRRGTDVERGATRGGPPPSEDVESPGYPAALRAILAAQCGGSAITPPETAPHRDATRFVLGCAVLLGGVFGAPGCGVLGPASLALALWLARRSELARFWLGITRRMLVFATTATLIVALGLLLIEQHVASAFSAIPSFADAWLDAASAIGGANLTSDLASAITDRGLSSGIRTPTDQYQYGMLWLIAAMFIGRVAPLWILSRGARD